MPVTNFYRHIRLIGRAQNASVSFATHFESVLESAVMIDTTPTNSNIFLTFFSHPCQSKTHRSLLEFSARKHKNEAGFLSTL